MYILLLLVILEDLLLFHCSVAMLSARQQRRSQKQHQAEAVEQAHAHPAGLRELIAAVVFHDQRVRRRSGFRMPAAAIVSVRETRRSK